MKIETDNENGHVTTQINDRVFCTNAFAMNLESDKVAWDLTDPENPILECDVTDDGENYSFARAHPCLAISKFGRYETVDFNSLPDLGRDRGQGGMACPAKDLEPLQKRIGYPCMIKDLPVTAVPINCSIPKHMNANTLIDLYIHFMEAGAKLNDQIDPNASKLLNIQIQLGCGRANNPKAHAKGWSGGTIILKVKVGGLVWSIAYKHETANGADFPFISFYNEKAKNVDVDVIVKWLLSNWSEIEKACEEKGCDLFGVTLEKLLDGATCGPHVGNEILGKAVGQIKWKGMAINVGGPAFKEGEFEALVSPVSDDSITPPVAEEQEERGCSREHVEAAGTLGDPIRTKELSLSYVGQSKAMPGSHRPGAMAGNVVSHGNSQGLISETGTWGSVMVKSLCAGEGDIIWVNHDGVHYITLVTVPR